MIETSRYTAVVLEKPERYIGGKDAVKLEVTFKPTSERYDYTNNYFIKNGNKYNRAYRLLSFVTTDFSLTLWYDADNSSGDRLQVQVKSETTTVDDVETSEPFGNLFEDGQVHTVGFEYTSTGYVRYWIDGVQQSK
ncbi:MAG: hypothetical protein U9Q38_06680, partial [Thermodesulfobacteriota bacterium]|nr:hypothetical protein [Thermodesulfobacteriota bacterium]